MNKYKESFSASVEYFNGDELAASVFLDKYSLRADNGLIIEPTPEFMHRRLAKEFARIEKNKFKKPLTEDEIFFYFDHFKYIIPQGGLLYGVGNNKQIVSLSNCYVVSSPVDSYGGILKTDQELVQISKRRGGVGTDISTLRPSGSPTKNSSRSSSGLTSFANRYSNSIREVGQDGRRGALMLIVNVHHPEIMNFISCKNDEKSITGANISIKLTDEFLKAVQNDKDYELRFPVDSDKPIFSEKISARKVWKAIIHNAWLRAEPGLLFWDNIKNYNSVDCYADVGFETVATNPCCIASSDNAMVITKNGIKELKEIKAGDKIWIDNEQTWSITPTGYFSSGKADVKKVTFSNGEVLHLTNNHKLSKLKYKRIGRKTSSIGYELTKLQDLKINDKISININPPSNFEFGSLGTKEEGYIMGWLTGDGCLTYKSDADNFPITSLDFWSGEFDVADKIYQIFKSQKYDIQLTENKKNNKKAIKSSVYTQNFIEKYQYNIWTFKSETLPCDFLYKASEDFIKSYLSSYFSADGTVHFKEKDKNYCIQLSSINKNRLFQIKNILNLFGIKSYVGLVSKAGVKTFVNHGGKYKTKDCWRLSITGLLNLERFYNKIGFFNDRKNNILKSILDSVQTKKNSNYYNCCKIVSIEDAGTTDVGCIEVENYHQFTVNGIISGNSELPLCVDDSCRLLVVNLYSYVKNPFTKEAKIDYELLHYHAKIAQRLMDDVIDLEIEKLDQIIKKIEKDPESIDVKKVELDLWKRIKEKCVNGRRTGLGVTGEGDMIAAMGLSYGSEESIRLVGEVHKTIKLASFRSSMEMAKELGAFPVWDWKKEKDSAFLKQIEKEDSDLYQQIKQYGRRNIANLTVAPTGSVCIIAQTTGGIEPLFELSYTRRKKINPSDKNARIDYIDSNGDCWQEFKVYHPKVREWMNITKETDVKKSPWFGSCAEQIDWKNRVRLQAAIQKHIDHAISSTINLPEDVSESKIAEIYEAAWEHGLKGITVYRKGCRAGVMIDDKQKNKIKKTIAPDRPDMLMAEMHHLVVKGHRYYCAVGIYSNDPYEVFVGDNHNSDGEIIIPKSVIKGHVWRKNSGRYLFITPDKTEYILMNKHSDPNIIAITRLVSTALRHGSSIEFIVEQLGKVEGDLNCFSKVLARTLKKYIIDGTAATGETCPSCGASNLVYAEGCKKCLTCGASACN